MFKLEKIFTRLTFLFLFVVMVFILGFAFFTQYEKSRLELLLDQRASEKAIFFENIIRIHSSTLKTFAYDYTFYDEMVSYVKTGDRKWAKENIDPGLETFKANAVWIYRPDASLIYSVDNLNSTALKEAPIPKSFFKEIFEKDKLPVFFVETEHGLMEIVGATIHPTVDKERKTRPRGYFFAGRLWNSEYLNELSRLIESRLEILPYTGEEPVIGYDRESKTIIVSKTLHKWDGIPVAVLYTQSDTPIFKEIASSFNISLLTLVLFSILILFAMAFFITRWIVLPLRSISSSLVSGNPSFLDSIKKDRSEFGILALLIKRFFTQKERLLSEIKGHQEAERAMLASQTRLKALFELSPEAIYLETPECRIIDCNPASSQMTGYSKGELLQMTAYDLVPEENKEKISKLMNKGYIENVHFVEHSNIKKNGTIFPVEAGIKSIKIEEEKYFHCCSQGYDGKKKDGETTSQGATA